MNFDSKKNSPKILRDLTTQENSQNETKLNLRTEQNPAPESPIIPNKPLDLKNKSHFKSSKSKPSQIKDIRDLSENKSSEQKHFENIDLRTPSIQPRFREALRIAAGGLLLLFTINLINLFQIGTSTKDLVTATALSGFEGLSLATEATKSFNFSEANYFISAAKDNFSSARQQLGSLNQIIESHNSISSPVSLGPKLLEVGDHISIAGENFLAAAQDIDKTATLFLESHKDLSQLSRNQKRESITEDIKRRLDFIKQAQAETIAAQEILETINIKSLPENYQAQIKDAANKITSLNSALNSLNEITPIILKLLGDKHPHRYLILLQNNSEARPTGGFIGSFILMDVNDGYITRFEFKDVYDADGQLHENIPAPEEISQLTDNWRLRDSNYSPDFSISAEKAAWFLEKEKGPTVDTVIAVNKSILEDLLKISGPIQLEGLSQPITAENQHAILTFLVESKWAGQDSPKEVIKNFIPAVQSKVTSKENLPDFINLILDEVRHKNIIFYSKDSAIQEFFNSRSLDGKVIKQPEHTDYLSVISTSIGGNKSDRYLHQKLFHNTYLEPDGSITNELTISREHTFSDLTQQHIVETVLQFGFESVPGDIMAIIGRGNNKAAIKVYVPKGSEILDTSGLLPDEITTRYNEDLDKTYFYFFSEIEPGQTDRVTIRYRLPYKLDLWPADEYQLIVQKQPGAITPIDFEKKIIPNTPLSRHALFPEGWEDQNGIVTYRTNLLYDRLFGGIWSQ